MPSTPCLNPCLGSNLGALVGVRAYSVQGCSSSWNQDVKQEYKELLFCKGKAFPDSASPI